MQVVFHATNRRPDAIGSSLRFLGALFATFGGSFFFLKTPRTLTGSGRHEHGIEDQESKPEVTSEWPSRSSLSASSCSSAHGVQRLNKLIPLWKVGTVTDLLETVNDRCAGICYQPRQLITGPPA